MTPRPPTLRENRRYILAGIEPAGTPIDQKELYYMISDAVTSLWGDAAAGIITPAVVAAEHGHVIVRCTRGAERELALALSTVTSCRNSRIAVRPLATSGTMESLRSRIRTGTVKEAGRTEPGGPEPGLCPEAECLFAAQSCVIVCCNGQKVDVIEKGFKNAHRLFVTKSDLENA